MSKQFLKDEYGTKLYTLPQKIGATFGLYFLYSRVQRYFPKKCQAQKGVAI